MHIDCKSQVSSLSTRLFPVIYKCPAAFFIRAGRHDSILQNLGP